MTAAHVKIVFGKQFPPPSGADQIDKRIGLSHIPVAQSFGFAQVYREKKTCPKGVVGVGG